MPRLRTFALLLLACVPAAASEAEKERIRFERIAPTPGLIRTKTDHFKRNLVVTVQVDRGVCELSQAEQRSETRKEVVLGVTDGAPSKVRVTYGQISTTIQGPNGTHTVSSPVAGKTYVVERKDGKSVVTDKNGVAPPADQSSIVAADFADLGSIDPLTKFLIGKEFAPGREFAVPDEVSRILFRDDQLKVEKFTVTLRGRREVNGIGCAVLDTVIIRRAPAAGKAMTMELKGEMVVALRTSWPVSLELEGAVPVSLELEGAVEVTGDQPEHKMLLAGEGTLVIGIRCNYERGVAAPAPPESADENK